MTLVMMQVNLKVIKNLRMTLKRSLCDFLVELYHLNYLKFQMVSVLDNQSLNYLMMEERKAKMNKESVYLLNYIELSV